MHRLALAAAVIALASLTACEAQYYSLDSLGLAGGSLNRATTDSRAGTVRTFTDANFNSDVILSPRPVLVDCGAPWCGPCRAMDPVVHDAAAMHAATAVVGKLDITTSPVIARRYGLNAVPCILVFKNGVVVQRVIGYQNKERLSQMLAAAGG